VGGIRRRWWRRHEHRLRLTRLSRYPDHARTRAIRGTEWLWLILSHGSAREQRKNDEPAIGQLIVARHNVARVSRFAVAREVLEHVVGGHRPEQHFSRRIVLPALLREDRDAAAVHDLHDVIRPDRQGIVGGIATAARPVWSLKTDAEAVEAGGEDRGWLRARRRLFDVRAGSRDGCANWRSRPSFLLRAIGIRRIALVGRREHRQRLGHVGSDGVVCGHPSESRPLRATYRTGLPNVVAHDHGEHDEKYRSGFHEPCSTGHMTWGRRSRATVAL